MSEQRPSRGLACGDLDGDGSPEILTGNPHYAGFDSLRGLVKLLCNATERVL